MRVIDFSKIQTEEFKTNKDYTYVDLHLDLEQPHSPLDKNTKFSDIKIAPDERAIRNSILNIFNTSKRERPLYPEFGETLRRFLFEPLTDFTMTLLGNAIEEALGNWEPRVKIDKVKVSYDPNQYTIYVQLLITILNLDKKMELLITGSRDNGNFSFTT